MSARTSWLTPAVTPLCGLVPGTIDIARSRGTRNRPSVGCAGRSGVPQCFQMTASKIKKEQRTQTGNKVKRELPWNVILHNDWENSMPRVVIILKKIIPGMTLKKATRIMWEAHTTGKAVVKSCHKELAELYQERLLAEGLSVSIEPAG